MNDALVTRMQSPGPKKILSCDGGGILGLISVEILAKMEDDLRVKLGRGAEFVLADYFYFVCGTSTGAIIAACISAGMSMPRIRQFYVESGQEMFDKACLLKRLNYKYNDEPLARKLRGELSKALGDDITLGTVCRKDIIRQQGTAPSLDKSDESADVRPRVSITESADARRHSYEIFAALGRPVEPEV